MKKIILLSLLILPATLLASATDAEVTRYFLQTGRETDFNPRVFNFIIWVSLLYYLLANPVKDYFTGRSKGIEGQLNEIEVKLQAAKDEKKLAQSHLDESKTKASQILENAKNDAIFLAKKISEANENELNVMKKQLEDKMLLEEKKSVREAIDTVLSENITNDDIMLYSNKVVDIISKKVADGKVA